MAQRNDRLRESLSERGGMGPPEGDLCLPVPIRYFSLRVGTHEGIEGGFKYVAGSPFAGFEFHSLSGETAVHKRGQNRNAQEHEGDHDDADRADRGNIQRVRQAALD